ncbi:MAG: DEAD/DEAH box helicase [Candidatus Hydrogenedentota bacterium]
MGFEHFDIDNRCLRVLDAMGIETPTPVQEQTIPLACAGKDIIATAQTGTGKTLAFSLPTLTHLAREKHRNFRMLVLAPTRELTIQDHAVVDQVAKALQLRTTLLYGGVGFTAQLDELRRGPDVVVATPGRLLDHMGRGRVRFNELEVLILDEADRMLDMGFLPDIRRILAKLPDDRQTLLFSATFAPELERLVNEFMRAPERITVGMVHHPVDEVRQVVYPVRQEDKSQFLTELLRKTENLDSAIVFLRTKDRTHRLSKTLRKNGFRAAAIHGDLSQQRRQQALQGFREGRYNILVATDVAARGLDIENVSHVINYDIPPNADDYIHRVGRTARASREGDAVTFVTPQDYSELGAIERALGRSIERIDYENAPQVLSTWQAANENPRLGKMSRSGTMRHKRRRLL